MFRLWNAVLSASGGIKRVRLAVSVTVASSVAATIDAARVKEVVVSSIASVVPVYQSAHNGVVSVTSATTVTSAGGNATAFLLLETGDYLLLETGDKILKEAA